MLDFWELKGAKLKERVSLRLDSVLGGILSKDTDPGGIEQMRDEYLEAFRRTAKELRRLKKATTQNQRESRGWRLFRSSYFQKSMLVLALYGNKRRREKIQYGLTELQCLPSQLCNVTKQSEKFILYYEKKTSNEGNRPLCNFGLIRYVQQFGVMVLLTVLKPKTPHIYGAQDSVLEIGKCLKEGKHHVITTDLKNSFSSITKRHVRELGLLDKRLINYVVFPCFHSYAKHDHSQKETPQALLPQGGAASSLIQSLVIDAIIQQELEIKKTASIICSADDIAICSDTIEGATTAFDALKLRMVKHPAGSLILHKNKLCLGRYFINEFNSDKNTNPVDFLGYRVHIYPPTGEVAYRPNQKSYNKFWRRVRGIGYEGKLPIWWHPKTSNELLESIAVRHFVEWSRSFPLWDVNRDLIKKIVSAENKPHKQAQETLAEYEKSEPLYARSYGAYNLFALNMSERISEFKYSQHSKLAA